MTLEQEARLSFYKEVAVIDRDHGVSLVQHTETGQFYVKKITDTYDRRVYEYLKENHITQTPVIYDLFEDGSELIVIEEYIKGESLSDVLEKNKYLSTGEAVDITLQLLDILEKFHEAPVSIIHRDIKPENIIISEENRVSLLDMNTAKWVNDAKCRDTRLLGTVGYAAPEQYGFGVSDVRTDIYQVGVLLNVMLTGRYPNEYIAEGVYGKIIEGCIKMDPKDRFSTDDEIRRQLLLAANIGTGSSAEITENAIGYEETSAKEKDKKIRRYLPVGFRSATPLYMVLAGIGYAILIILSASLKIQDGTSGWMWLNRITFFLVIFLVINLSSNWFNIWKKLLDKKAILIPCIIIVDILVVFVAIGAMYLLKPVV